MNALKILDFFRRSPEKTGAFRLYQSIVLQSRSPRFYLEFGVPDSVDGRFDMIALHVFLVLHRLKKDHPQSARLTQALFDLLFADMDQNLREMGVGDLSVGRKIKTMTAAFQGRLVAYESSLDNQLSLQKALERNLYRHIEPKSVHLEKMAQYIGEQVDMLEQQTTGDLMQGNITFSPLMHSARATSNV